MIRLCALLVALLCAIPARAEVFVVPPPGYKGKNGDKVGQEIVTAIWEYLGEHTVLLPNQAVDALPANQRRWCVESDCMEAYRSANKADAAIAVRVYARTQAGPATSFQIQIQPKPGIEYRQGAVIDPKQPLADQVRVVLEKLWHRFESKEVQPHLTITGAPEGAMVYVDDKLKGTIPAYLTLSAGTYRVRLEKTGYTPATRIVTLHTATSEETTDLRLEPASSQPGPLLSRAASETRARTTKERTAIGLLASGAAVLVASAAYATFAALEPDEGRCIANANAPTCQNVQSNSHRGQKLGIGVGLSTLGLGLMSAGAVVLKRERASIAIGPNAAMLSVGRSF
jgi:hypothetical protein